MLQKPEEKPGIMIVLLGGQGTGKGTFFELLNAIWSLTCLKVSDVDHVIGQFNAAIERIYIVFMDEALFAGDKKALDRLKSMVTESTVTIEQKRQPRRTIKSVHRFIAASNHDHFIKVDGDDRRFFFLRVSDARKGDFDYWQGLHAAIKNPAVIAAMVHDLMEVSLDYFNVRDRPKSTEHMEQKLQSLSGFDRYWFEVLQTGYFDPRARVLPAAAWTDPAFVRPETLMREWEEFDRGSRQFAGRQEREIYKALERLCPSAEKARPKIGGKQQRGISLPSLPDARAEFATAMGGEVGWDG
jgi:hypothetical protein